MLPKLWRDVFIWPIKLSLCFLKGSESLNRTLGWIQKKMAISTKVILPIADSPTPCHQWTAMGSGKAGMLYFATKNVAGIQATVMSACLKQNAFQRW